MKVRAICFDYGGTLDGAGSHWLERFAQLYQDAWLALPFERVRRAFDHASRCGYADPQVARMDLQALIEFHVARQLEDLGIADTTLAGRVVSAFVRASRLALVEHRSILERLRHRVAVGVISNFYGNVDRLLAEAGIGGLATIIDSNRVGVSKPDPRIFALALEQLGCAPAEALHAGDSFDKDVRGARAAGWRTAWVVGAAERTCPAPELVDVRVRRLADLEAIIE